MIKLPKIVGEIRKIPIQSYKDIIDHYVDKVSILPAVKAIIQMGSFTTPGLSDIDLIVVLKEGYAAPSWGEISLKKHSEHFEHKEVIAHDIFVINEFIADNAEAYYYIDNQNVLYGCKIGGVISEEIAFDLRQIISLEYSVFSIENIFKLLLKEEIDIRTILLLISTSRHTAFTANSLGIISSDEKSQIVSRVEKIRSGFLNGLRPVESLTQEFSLFISLLFKVIRLSNLKLAQSRKMKGNFITKGSHKTDFYWIENAEEYEEQFKAFILAHENSYFARFICTVPIPIEFRTHLSRYSEISSISGFGLGTELNKIGKFEESYKLRKKVVLDHWSFLEKNDYLKASGKAYCGYGFSSKLPVHKKVAFSMIRYYMKYTFQVKTNYNS